MYFFLFFHSLIYRSNKMPEFITWLVDKTEFPKIDISINCLLQSRKLSTFLSFTETKSWWSLIAREALAEYTLCHWRSRKFFSPSDPVIQEIKNSRIFRFQRAHPMAFDVKLIFYFLVGAKMLLHKQSFGCESFFLSLC